MKTLRSIVAGLLAILSVLCADPGYTQSHLPYDLVVNTTDSNGWPVNPLWGAQVPTVTTLPDWTTCSPWKAGCSNSFHWTDTSGVKCPDTVFKHVPFPGHVNFAGTVLTGTVSWADHSGDDDDYNLDITPDGGGGLTTSDPQSIRLLRRDHRPFSYFMVESISHRG